MEPTDDDIPQNVLIQSLRAERDVRLHSLAPRVHVTDERMRDGIAELRVMLRTVQVIVGLVLIAVFTTLALVVAVESAVRR